MEKKVILLADDDRDDTEMFCEALEDVNENVICHCAFNGSETLKILGELDKNPELIFLDVNMPVMNGWDCLKMLKSDERYREIPVIMISTSSYKNDMEIASNLGSICYFVKPNDFNDLKYILRYITSNLGSNLKDALVQLQIDRSGIIFTCNT
ncbi:response regulator [Flavobacterium reichenbachii]|uniref:Histidine kinase n=1 Tax=Flavobacterium reichenbachii TaxID=362418 RepID=A0A085ZM98_9FLAO|nr:response regulator [Flavobacterium reichenbachii]KFF05562.1 histidine kinase [Flavobacterium reichenbachii]OXB17899.1 response regulator [Flavobacterium reichenbachii]